MEHHGPQAAQAGYDGILHERLRAEGLGLIGGVRQRPTDLASPKFEEHERKESRRSGHYGRNSHSGEAE